MLGSYERARSTRPELPVGRFLKSKCLGGNRVILAVIRLNYNSNLNDQLLRHA
jgi:hypothetical protein